MIAPLPVRLTILVLFLCFCVELTDYSDVSRDAALDQQVTGSLIMPHLLFVFLSEALFALSSRPFMLRFNPLGAPRLLLTLRAQALA